MAVCCKYSLLISVRSKNPQEVWGVFGGLRVAIFGRLRCIKMDEWVEWGNEIRADPCSGRRIKLQFQGAGAHPRLLERRNGVASGFYDPLKVDDRFSSRQILSEVLWRLNTLLSASGYPAFQLVSASGYPRTLFGWRVTTGICCLPMSLRCRGSLFDSRSCALRGRRPP